MAGGFAHDHLDVRLRSADGLRLAGSYLPGPDPVGTPGATAVLLAHGFAANRRKPAYVRLAETLATRSSVLSLDLRGHGASEGRSTLGDQERHDVAAGVAFLRAWGHQQVVAIGVSMGSTAVLHAVSVEDAEVAAIVTVSGPAWFRSPPPPGPMRSLDTLWRSPLRRTGLRLALGVRLAGPEAWGPPPHPVEMAGRITVPLLAVHGVDDPYFPPQDAADLAAASAGPASVWEEPAGFGHAEDGLHQPFLARLVEEVASLVGR